MLIDVYFKCIIYYIDDILIFLNFVCDGIYICTLLFLLLYCLYVFVNIFSF